MKKLMSKLFEEAQRYVGKVKIDISKDDADLEYNQENTIPFNLSFNEKSWGMSDLTLTFPELIQIEYSESGKKEELSLDLNNAEVIWNKSNTYSIDSVQVYLDSSGKITNMNVYMLYIDPNS